MKHQWEHSPHWTQTQELKISKHQQVQLLEAASILIGLRRADSSSSSTAPPVPLLHRQSYLDVFDDDEDDDEMDPTAQGVFGMDDY